MNFHWTVLNTLALTDLALWRVLQVVFWENSQLLLHPTPRSLRWRNNKTAIHCKNISYQSLTLFIHDDSIIDSFPPRLLPDIQSEHKNMSYCTEIRWLSCHKLLDAFYVLIGESMSFLAMKHHFNNIKIWTFNEIWHFVYITNKPWENIWA